MYQSHGWLITYHYSFIDYKNKDTQKIIEAVLIRVEEHFFLSIVA